MIELHTYLHYLYTNAFLAGFQKAADLIIKNLKLLGHNSVHPVRYLVWITIIHTFFNLWRTYNSTLGTQIIWSKG